MRAKTAAANDFRARTQAAARTGAGTDFEDLRACGAAQRQNDTEREHCNTATHGSPLRQTAGRPGPSDPTHFLNIWIEIERNSGDLDLVPGLESLGFQRAQHANPAQPALQVCERVLVVKVVASDEPLDPGPGDAEARSEEHTSE